MPEEAINDSQVEQVDVQDTETKDTETKQEPDFHEDTIGFIKSAQKEQTDSSGDTGEVDDSESDEDDDVLEELAGTDIPDEFSDAAEAVGITPADIKKLADKRTDEELMELIPILKDAAKPQEDIESSEKDTKEADSKDDTSDDSTKIEQEIAERIEKQLSEKYGVSLNEVKNLKAEREKEKVVRNFDFAMSKIDGVVKEFPIFSKMDELPKFESGKLKGQYIPTHPAVKARMEVVGYADVFMSVGQSIEEAMDNALATYKGKHLTKELERNLIKDLKKHETNLSGHRTGKVTKKTYSDSREEDLDYIRQLQRASGQDV